MVAWRCGVVKEGMYPFLYDVIHTLRWLPHSNAAFFIILGPGVHGMLPSTVVVP